jgi:(2Fe-2S) ferredoxin
MLAVRVRLSSDAHVKKSKLIDSTRREPDSSRVARRHLFVCTNARSSGKPACGARGGSELLTAVQHELLARGAADVLVTACSCLGPCFDGPNAVVYPDGVWYAGLDASDAPSLAGHLIDGITFAAKVTEAPGIDDSAAGGEER